MKASQKIEQVFSVLTAEMLRKTCVVFFKGGKNKQTNNNFRSDKMSYSTVFSIWYESRELQKVTPSYKVGVVVPWLKYPTLLLLIDTASVWVSIARECLSWNGRKWQQFNLYRYLWPLLGMFVCLSSSVFVISLLPYPSILTKLINSRDLEVIPSLFSLILCFLLSV